MDGTKGKKKVKLPYSMDVQIPPPEPEPVEGVKNTINGGFELGFISKIFFQNKNTINKLITKR